MAEVAKRKIDDAGEKIGGARKDWAKERMNASDVADMTDEERVAHIQKDNIWPKPDFAALVEAGMSREAAAQIKIIRERIAKAPALSNTRPHATSLKWYFDTLSEVGKYLEACRTLEEVRNAYEALNRKIALKDDRSVPRDVAKEAVSKYYVINKGRSHPLYCRPYEDDPKIRVLLSQGFPDDIPAWRRGHTVRKLAGRTDFGIIKGGRNVVAAGFETETAALDWLKEQWEANRADRKAGKNTQKVPERPHLDHIERTGLPDRRNGEDIDEQTFIDVFGFRAVEFGEWLPDDERQLVLNHGYDALMDLADALGFTPGQISLDGTLAIAFGARGQSGFAAHYESGRRVVNLTRLSGAGALAHEWGHALDHYIGTGAPLAMEIQSVTGWRKRVDDCRPYLKHRGAAVANSAFDVMSSIRNRPRTRTEALEEAEPNIAAFEKTVASYVAAMERRKAKAEELEVKLNAADMRKLAKGMKSQEDGLAYWTRRRDQILASGDDANFGIVTSNFVNEAIKISGAGGYWNRPNELFARAFESYVNDTLEDKGGSSNYLVAWADERFYPHELYRGNPYPQGEERKRMNSSWDVFISNVAELVPDRSVSPPVVSMNHSAPTAK